MIRFYTPADAPAMLEIYRPHVTGSTVSFEYVLPTVEEFTARLNGFAGFYPVLVCEIGGKIAGYAYAHRLQERKAFDWNAELSIYIDRAYTERGIGRRLYQALFEILRLQNLRRLYALISLPNDESCRFHQAMGFKTAFIQKSAGFKMGRWCDLMWMNYDLAPLKGTPEPIRSVHDLPRETLMNIFDTYDDRFTGK